MASASCTTIIFVPGAWHSPTCYAKLLAPLESAGYSTSLVHLPTVNPSNPQTSFSSDVQAIRTAIITAAEAGQKILLVVHSYGGIPASEAVHGLDVASRAKEGLRGGVSHLFYCCSFLIPKGQSLMSAFGGADLPWWSISPDRTIVNPLSPEEIFYDDMSPPEIETAISELNPHAYQSFSGIVTYEAWRDVPTTYLYCLQDKAIPMRVQRMLVQEFARGAGIRTETVNASHSPFYSVPGEVVKAIRRAAGEHV
ncbi:Alpha/beta hydrolase fold-1 [Aspergillus keveii]|jgi:pimeloyl-ACP methyl ester carboxylesterase|uniref:Alpha/beta hydrolase fold-1 n=1 Tax=Aspergillus keveii TaxID=714993 RepID=A0ABR4GNH9_9EURO